MTALPLKDFTATDIKKIRNDFGATQAAFAEILGVSKKTIEAWEAGRNRPDGPARRLLAAIEADPHFPAKYCLSQNDKEIVGPFDTIAALMDDLNDVVLR